MTQLLLNISDEKKDKKIVERIKDLQLLEPDKRKTLFDLIDTYIRDFKTRQAYTS